MAPGRFERRSRHVAAAFRFICLKKDEAVVVRRCIVMRSKSTSWA